MDAVFVVYAFVLMVLMELRIVARGTKEMISGGSFQNLMISTMVIIMESMEAYQFMMLEKQ
jgi:hypothetical protein